MMRRQYKKSMKQRIIELKEAVREASLYHRREGFIDGVNAVLTAAHHLDYGEGYDVTAS